MHSNEHASPDAVVHRIGDISLRLFDADRDSEIIRAIVAEIWSGGGPALAEKRFGIIGGKTWDIWTSNAVLTDFKADPTRSFVAVDQGKVIGFCAYTLDHERSRGTVGYNGIAKSHQGKGLGSALISFVLDRIRAEGMQYAGVIVQDNEEHAPARRIYEKHGFSKLSGNYYMIQKL